MDLIKEFLFCFFGHRVLNVGSLGKKGGEKGKLILFIFLD